MAFDKKYAQLGRWLMREWAMKDYTDEDADRKAILDEAQWLGILALDRYDSTRHRHCGCDEGDIIYVFAEGAAP